MAERKAVARFMTRLSSPVKWKVRTPEATLFLAGVTGVVRRDKD